MNRVPPATISKKGARSVRAGHPWVYESDVLDSPGTPGLCEVRAPGDEVLGHALVSPNSVIRLRLVTRGREDPTAALIADRATRALARRRTLLPHADAFRVIHGEADLLPGIFVDLYNDCLVAQALSAGSEVILPAVLDALSSALDPRAVVVRDDASARAREGLPREVRVLAGEAPVTAQYHEGDLLMEADLINDQKTGGFLDQTYNHLRARDYGRGEALDCFTYHGGFALQLAGVCERVTACDQSTAALDRGRANAERNGITNVQWVAENAFDLLRRYVDEQRRFDTVVLDPPAFASTRDTVARAIGAYEEINRLAMALLRPDGVLITCSCSGRITAAAFDQGVTEAGRKAKRSVQFLERREAGVDHPRLATVPETAYLKCRILAVL